MDLVRRKADLAKRKEKWEVQKAEHEKQKKGLAACGLAMAKAGPLLLLKNVVLDAEVGKSAAQSTNIRRVQNIQKGKGRQYCDSIDSLLGKILILMNQSLIRSWGCGQHMTRVMNSENKLALCFKFTCFVVLIVCCLLGGTLWKVARCKAV